MAAKSFSAAIADFAKKTEAEIEDVFQEAPLLLASEIRRSRNEGGNLPYVSGNLQRSLAASTIGPPAVLWRQKEFSGSLEGIAEIIQGARIGQTIWIGFQAPYAMKVEKGESGGFVALAAQRWDRIVAEAVGAVTSRSG